MGQQLTLGFVGAGKVGHTLARLWFQRGFSVSAVYSRTSANAQALANIVGAMVVELPSAVAEMADLTLLTVPDDMIEAVVDEISKAELHLPEQNGKGVVHVSGANEVGLLTPLLAPGFLIGGLHPVFPFADVETAMQQLPGATFGVEAEAALLQDWLAVLVETLDGRILPIPPGGRAIYHSALVFASNYAVTLYAIAERLLVSLDAEREVADMALNALLSGMVENLRQKGVPEALTGPLVRSDVGTIEAHLRALAVIDADLGALYKQLARLSLPMLTARDIDPSLIQELLDRDNYASDHP